MDVGGRSKKDIDGGHAYARCLTPGRDHSPVHGYPPIDIKDAILEARHQIVNQPRGQALTSTASREQRDSRLIGERRRLSLILAPPPITPA